jgi:gliding motility-associated-like protein
MKYILYFVLFFSIYSKAQLQLFTINIQKTNETCTSNASINVTTQNTIVGATVTFQLFLQPNITTPIFNNTSGNFTSLNAGNYLIKVTQSFNNETFTKQQDVVISNDIVSLTYSVNATPEICGNDAVLTVNVLSGLAVNYEIISGPMTRPLQTSNVFTGLTSGLYNVRVFNNCGEGVVLSFTIIKKDAGLSISSTNQVIECNILNLDFNFSVSSPLVIAYPLQISITVNPPSGSPIVVNAVSNQNSISVGIPFYSGQTYSYQAIITDSCENTYQSQGNIFQTFTPFSEVTKENCLGKIKICQIVSATLTAAPVTYAQPLPQNLNSLIINGCIILSNLLPGSYTFNVIDECGKPHIITKIIDDCTEINNSPQFCTTFCTEITCVEFVTIIAAPATFQYPLPYQLTIVNDKAEICLPNGLYTLNLKSTCKTDPEVKTINFNPTYQIPDFGVFTGCENGKACLRINSSKPIISIVLVNAPANYTSNLPQDLSQFLLSLPGANVLNNFVLCNLTAGNYKFMITQECITHELVIPIVGYQENTIVEIERNCGTFNLNLQHTANNNFTTNYYWLQKFNTNTNQWEHPITGVAYTTGNTPDTVNSLQLTNNSTYLNIAQLGNFRVIKHFFTFQSGSLQPVLCIKILNEFEFTNNPKINAVYTFNCGNNLYDVIIDAQGKNPLKYRITSKNGQPFFVNNNTSSIFLGLTTGVYNFQVEDACGNILNSLHTISLPYQFIITAQNLCFGENGILKVPLFSFLNYSWYLDSNPTNILSTTNELNLNNFNPNTQSGIYKVRIRYLGNPNSCIDYTVAYNVNQTAYFPNAGTPQNQNLCGQNGQLNLFNFITGQSSNAGTWSEITNSGLLTNSVWNSNLALAGTYQFKYKVEGLCNTSNECLLAITIKPIPSLPIITTSGNLCIGNNIQLSVSNVPTATYLWSGPNNFTSNLQNIEFQNTTMSINGIYTVKTIIDGCESLPKSIEIKLENNPEFYLKSGCENDKYFIEAIPINNTYNPDNVNYSWSNDLNNINTNQAKIDITGFDIGTYKLTITTPNGCFNQNKLLINRTICKIPNGVSPNDNGENDTFDLTGFDVELIKIFNRYGTMVYEYYNYTNQWNGQDYNGNILPTATYYYYLKLKNGTEKTGWVYLLTK